MLGLDRLLQVDQSRQECCDRKGAALGAMETGLILLTTFRVANISRWNSHFWALWLGPSGRYLWEKQNRTKKYDSTMFLKKQLVLHRHPRHSILQILTVQSSQVDKAPAWDGSVSLEKGPMKFPSGLLRARCPWRWTWIQKNGKTSSVDFLQNHFDRKMLANFRAETGTKADGPRWYEPRPRGHYASRWPSNISHACTAGTVGNQPWG